ncbi:hypothetical protein EYZ11_006017 [Aspergillus tanneri]|uniref:SWR1-complex protein 5 n=1 Tax=Aspergillus tanneri TaxID=1220188 RepID=A0A4V3UPB4_9EURO|nr:swr complex subunit [Aspergillus tanneri]KAA8651421.1 swr complex subunit [Aspergillus tanneri]THC94494.1 hypothetical protein EYZ11_006017 [Aspergillus tanneri]
MAPECETVLDFDLENEQYDSAEDEDFQLDAAQDDDVTSSDSDNETVGPANKKRKRGKKETELQDDELGSGDEAMIQKAKARKERKRKGKKSNDNDTAQDDDDIDFDDDDDEGGPGGFVRTRAMKLRAQEERKPLAKIDGATVDVDALWARMNAPDTDFGLYPSRNDTKEDLLVNGEKKDTEMQDTPSAEPEGKQNRTKYPEDMVKIKRTYKFAGETITEEKVVPKDSAEAKIYLSNGNDAETVTAEEMENLHAKTAFKLRRPLRKISRFDPNPTGSIKKSWEKQPAAETSVSEENAGGPKINTVEKSRLDWAAYVDKAGIKDELNVHSKAKEGFLGRMDFLDRVGAKKDEERRNARLRGM